MTQDEILEMAIQAGFDEHHAKFDTRMKAFAKLVADKERRECADIADSWKTNVVWENKMLATNIAREIRDRSNSKGKT